MGCLGCGFRVVHSAWRFTGRDLCIFPRIVCGTVGVRGTIVDGMLDTGRLMRNPFHWMSSVMGYWVGHS